MTTLSRCLGTDTLGLRDAMPGRLLQAVAGAVTWLAVLTLAGAGAVERLAAPWQDIASTQAVLVPQPDLPAAHGPGTRADAVAARLAAIPGLMARRLGQAELDQLMRPWLDSLQAPDTAGLPAAFELQGVLPAGLDTALAQAAPATRLTPGPAWAASLPASARRLLLAGYTTAGLVAVGAATLVALATRDALTAQFQTMATVLSMGATDRLIADQYAALVAYRAAGGAVLGTGAAVLCIVAAMWLLGSVPAWIWWFLPAYPSACVAIAWGTAQATVRLQLRQWP